MDNKEEIIDFKKHEYLIEQYVILRNSYAEQLLTSPVNISDTKEWLKLDDVEIRGIVRDDVLLGVAILYLHRDGEVAFFVKDKNKGTGSKLLKIIEVVSIEKKIKLIWGWVLKDNLIAQRVFEKSGFLRGSVNERQYKGLIKQGYIYKKYLTW
ncbi:MAG: GNAT family N-acetyltransferase [Deltaproteobacteria bacterium]|nr:GNAT family N-acetyltransferase [Deltaproteobacteria bacterium]